MDYLGRQGVGSIRNQVDGGTKSMLPGYREEELMHASVQNRGHGAGDSQLLMCLRCQYIRERVAHQCDWEWSTSRMAVMPKPETIPQHVRPIGVIRFLLHLVVECGKRRASIPALIPRVKEETDSADSISVAVVRSLQ